MVVNTEVSSQYKVKMPRNKRSGGQRHTAEDSKREKAKLDATIAKKKRALENALKCPPAIHQFRQKMDAELKDKIEEIFMQYRPESSEDRAKREEEGKEKKGLCVKSGIREVVKLIEKKKAKIVLIANDTDPIEVVLFLPSLCKKMGVSYAIFDTRKRLGAIVRRNSAVCLALTEVVPGLEGLIKEVDEQFSDRYAETMKTWGKPGSMK